jgi:hypothetical protein
MWFKNIVDKSPIKIYRPMDAGLKRKARNHASETQHGEDLQRKAGTKAP